MSNFYKYNNMAYRNGTYVAFDGNGQNDPTKGDLKYLGILRAWKESDNIDFNFTDSHKKTYQVRDSSSEDTLKSRLEERMSNSKNMLVIISDDTNFDRGLLNWEIRTAQEKYGLPIIVAYAGEQYLVRLTDDLIEKLPKTIWRDVKFGGNHYAHIPFTKDRIKRAIDHYSVVSGIYPNSEKEIFF